MIKEVNISKEIKKNYYLKGNEHTKRKYVLKMRINEEKTEGNNA